ncbi:hypothetical protein Dip510_000526 [Elusimicrobium posterum]|uniref:DUF4861 family protein n=1 Tax=Elusimicrobium posterum TaxID=3116653 RepID=UPI003C726683
MKKLLSLIVAAFMLGACADKQMVVSVTNPSSLSRNMEIVEVDWKTVQQKLELGPYDTFIIYATHDAVPEQRPYQIITLGSGEAQKVIFQASVPAGKTVQYAIKKGVPAQFTSFAYARQVPERKDDFAWENDRIAFRMYGPALAKENPSNGVDAWMKKTANLIINKFYDNDLNKGISYHIDHGEGLDCYKVGHTLGAGGIAPYINGKLWVGDHYDKAEVLDNGPLRTTFRLTYNNFPVAGKKVRQSVTISLDAWSNMNKAVVINQSTANNLQLAAGIYLHDKIGDIVKDEELGYVAYSEDAVSDAGVPSGRTYTAVIFPGAKEIKQDKTHALVIADYEKGMPATYYFGAGWSKWHFPADAAWNEYVKDYALKAQQPLVVEY